MNVIEFGSSEQNLSGLRDLCRKKQKEKLIYDDF